MDFLSLLRQERKKERQKEQHTSTFKTEQDTKDLQVEPIRHQGKKEKIEWPLFLFHERKETIDLTKYSIQGNIEKLFYISNWISEKEEQEILKQVDTIPNESELWINLKTRRLQVWDEQVSSLPPWLHQLLNALMQCNLFPKGIRPDHVLLNDYAADQGIPSHQDGPLYYPFVAIISINSPAIMHFTPYIPPSTVRDVSNQKKRDSILLERRSLLLFTENAYHNYLHGIDNSNREKIPNGCIVEDKKQVGSTIQKERRISLTIRKKLRPMD